MRRRIRFPAILALATLSCGLAACGAVDPASDRGAEVQRASERTARVRTARFEIRYVERDGADETAGACEGAVSYPDKRYRFVCRHADSDMGPYEIELVSVGGATFVRYAGAEAPFADPDKPWVRLDLGVGDAEDDVLAIIDPVALLELLRSATVKTEHLGAERVRGVATERFRLTVDRRRAEPLGGGDDGPETFAVDVWVGDGLIRRMQAEDPPGSSGTFEFFDFGTPVDIEAPPTDRVAEVGEGEADYEPAPCPGGPTTAPLTVETVTRILGEYGIALKPLRSGCGGPRDIVIALTNGGSDEAGSDDSRGEGGIGPREGLVTCNLYAEPPGGAGTTLRTKPEGGVTRFELANLECTRFVPDDAPGFDLDALEDALRALESTLR
jgi:hypothetical protein